MAQKTPLPSLTVNYADRWNDTWFAKTFAHRHKIVEGIILRCSIGGFSFFISVLSFTARTAYCDDGQPVVNLLEEVPVSGWLRMSNYLLDHSLGASLVVGTLVLSAFVGYFYYLDTLPKNLSNTLPKSDPVIPTVNESESLSLTLNSEALDTLSKPVTTLADLMKNTRGAHSMVKESESLSLTLDSVTFDTLVKIVSGQHSVGHLYGRALEYYSNKHRGWVDIIFGGAHQSNQSHASVGSPITFLPTPPDNRLMVAPLSHDPYPISSSSSVRTMPTLIPATLNTPVAENGSNVTDLNASLSSSSSPRGLRLNLNVVENDDDIWHDAVSSHSPTAVTLLPPSASAPLSPLSPPGSPVFYDAVEHHPIPSNDGA